MTEPSDSKQSNLCSSNSTYAHSIRSMEGAEETLATVPVGSMTLIKHLAACNKATRDRSLRLLTTWLPSQHQVSDDDMKKLWKGLFYCVWHADKAASQADLIDRLCSLLHSLPLPLSLDYFSAFVLTIRREWSGIDVLRLDKFYLLIRRFIISIFVLLTKNNWDSELLRVLMGVLEEKALLADDKFLGNGVNYHIVSVYLDELKAFLPVKHEAVHMLFKPFLAVMAMSQDKVLVRKVKSNVFDILLKMGKELLDGKKMEPGGRESGRRDDIVLFGTIALTVGFSGKFFDLGSSLDCYQGNRKVLFSLYKEFLKLEKALESSGIETWFPEFKDDNTNEVPMLAPIIISETEVGASGSVLDAAEVVSESGVMSACKHSKKNKKARKGSDGCVKKIRIKKTGLSENCSEVEQNGNAIIANGDSSSNEPGSGRDIITFNESVISKLRKQFEKEAAEVDLDNNDTGSCDSPKMTVKDIPKKRKRARSMDGQDSQNVHLSGQGDAAAKSVDNSAKKVRFAMKNNMVWKPHSPLPPQSLRLPPSLTPRGSALKQGLPPGPIREMPPATKKVKLKKKICKGIKSTAPAIKRLRKIHSLSI